MSAPDGSDIPLDSDAAAIALPPPGTRIATGRLGPECAICNAERALVDQYHMSNGNNGVPRRRFVCVPCFDSLSTRDLLFDQAIKLGVVAGKYEVQARQVVSGRGRAWSRGGEARSMAEDIGRSRIVDETAS